MNSTVENTEPSPSSTVLSTQEHTSDNVAKSEESTMPWDAYSPFGRATENAAKYLFQIFHDPDFKCMIYSPGLADYNLDGVPELFLGSLGGNRSAGYYIFDVAGEKCRYMGEYFVASGGQRFTIAENIETKERYMCVISETRVAFEAIFSSSFFDPIDNSIDIWSINTAITLSDTMKVHGPYEEYFLNYQKIDDLPIIDRANTEWFNRSWIHSPAPAVEMDQNDWNSDALSDLDATRDLIYLLAATYYEQFSELISVNGKVKMQIYGN